MPATDDLSLLIDAAKEAGEIALRFHKARYQHWEKDDGAGPVTEADLAVNDCLAQRLRTSRPDYGWLSEESEDTQARYDKRHVFIIDPIDGTRSFIDGKDTWALSLAIAEAGQVTAGVVYLPALNRLYAASLGTGATCNLAPIKASGLGDLSQAEILAARPTFEAQHWRHPVDVKRAHRPSIAYRLALVAEGRFDGMLTLRRTWEWDIAAGMIISQEAGAKITDRTGKALAFNNPDPRVNGVLAANPALHSDIQNRLREE